MELNEAETRATLIDPALAAAGWTPSEIRREFKITEGRILGAGRRAAPQIADYFLVHGQKRLAVIEAKKASLSYTEGAAQAIEYAKKLGVPFALSTNGVKIRLIELSSGKQSDLESFPSPSELLSWLDEGENNVRRSFDQVPYEGKYGDGRYYQSIAVEKVLDAISRGEKRLLLTLATGTGKTRIAFQIAWKLFHSRWNLKGTERQPRVLFLADRNVLADQAYNEFSAFPEEALVRIDPREIARKGKVPTNGSIFFTIFQTFMTTSASEDEGFNFGSYPRDFFDLIIVDECHRGGANDESSWREILEYFSPAVQLGLTATPKRKDNVDTYKYFGEPLFSYSLKDGINDGFLTPFRVRKYQTSIDDYIWTNEDQVVEGDVETGKKYESKDFNIKIEIRERELFRVRQFMGRIKHSEKTIVFCQSQNHALLIRDLINEVSEIPSPTYCVRVTANDGPIGDKYLQDFKDNEKSIPTILTTSHKLSTGVDARNVRNIVILRPINSMIEFKQIIGRGTRIFEGKDFFTIHDFEDASHLFLDPEWDGEPESIDQGEEPPKFPAEKPTDKPSVGDDSVDPLKRRQMVKIKLADGKVREFQSMTSTLFYSVDGTPMSLGDFINSLYSTLAMPDLFSSEEELRAIWAVPSTRQALLLRLEDAGYGLTDLKQIQVLIDAENSDLFDVLDYIRFAQPPVPRRARARVSRSALSQLSSDQIKFINFLADQYEINGEEELSEMKLEVLIEAKYNNVLDGIRVLGGVQKAREIFLRFQQHLYLPNDVYAAI